MDLLGYIKPAVDYFSALVDTDLAAKDEESSAQQDVTRTTVQYALETDEVLQKSSDDVAALTTTSEDAKEVAARGQEPAYVEPRDGPDAIEEVVSESHETEAVEGQDVVNSPSADDERVQAMLLHASAVASSLQGPKCTVVLEPVELLRCQFDPRSSYMFNRKPMSLRKMTHEIAISAASGEKLRAHRLDTDDRTYITSLFTKHLLTAAPPVINFDGPDLLVTCANQGDLGGLFQKIEKYGKLGPLNAQIKTKGMPFTPIFWSLKGLSVRQDLLQLAKDVQSYADRNVHALGKWRIAYASVESIPCVDKSYFTGDVIIVTDAETFRNSGNKTLPIFQGNKPRRLPSLQGLHKFGTAV
ncbi:hypothetical protein PSEUBRA_006146 [Kalmanozyma brasiliensis GHG001]|uniref:uncharacterized protein n=1 Tax=Kalmanozyma brasiliensis (strain GHG001) TaxID=1365824 RepID=UPI001CEA3A2E|nr:uncharacterized protein PSEUBRA_006146 [Kalmanozyma brasiliensis GHG001]KAF6767627.1 hypothetical protein PSEUBRA_006146 [Kalmanozyma brasiliensis GHG001]